MGVSLCGGDEGGVGLLPATEDRDAEGVRIGGIFLDHGNADDGGFLRIRVQRFQWRIIIWNGPRDVGGDVHMQRTIRNPVLTILGDRYAVYF